MREILFRGKSTQGDGWVEGSYMEHYFSSRHGRVSAIFWNDDSSCQTYRTPVVPKTVGQYTGLTDKKGKKIFEGDIIKSDNGKQSAVSVIKFGEYYPKMFYEMLDMYIPGKLHLPSCGFYAESIDKHEEMILFQSTCVEIIGNVHDNPDLLDEK